MNHVQQRTKNDCGVACVAMLAGVSYEIAKAAFDFKRRRTMRTTAEDCINALRKLGIATERFFPLGPDPVESLTVPALLKTNKRRRIWHWAVYDPVTRRVLDPANQSATNHRVLSYLPIPGNRRSDTMNENAVQYFDDDYEPHDAVVVERNGNLRLLRDEETGEEVYRCPWEIQL